MLLARVFAADNARIRVVMAAKNKSRNGGLRATSPAQEKWSRLNMRSSHAANAGVSCRSELKITVGLECVVVHPEHHAVRNAPDKMMAKSALSSIDSLWPLCIVSISTHSCSSGVNSAR